MLVISRSMGSFPSTLKNTTGESKRTCTKWNHRIGRTPSSFWLIQVYQICSNHDCSRLKGYNMLQPSSSVFEFEDLGEVQIRLLQGIYRGNEWKLPIMGAGIAVEFAYSVFLSSLDTPNIIKYISHHRKAPTALWCLMFHWILGCPSWTRPRCKPFVKDPHDNVAHACPRHLLLASHNHHPVKVQSTRKYPT